MPVPLLNCSSMTPGWRPMQWRSVLLRSDSGFGSCLVSVKMILRSAMALRKKNSPSIGVANTSLITCRETMLHSCGHNHHVRPNMVLSGNWAIGVPSVAIDVPVAWREHHGDTCPRRGYTEALYHSCNLDLRVNWLKHNNKSPVCVHLAIGTSKSPM